MTNKAFIPLLLLCVTASAATPPLPIKRQAPLRSPAASVVSKDKPMLRTASVTEPPRLPMTGYFRKVQSEYGRFEFNAEALQPANQSILFELSPDLSPGSWVGLAWFGPYPTAQQVFAGLTSDNAALHIRATVSPAPATLTRVATTAGDIRINPAVRGAFARRGVR